MKKPNRKRTMHSITLPAELVERVKNVAQGRSNGFQPPFSRIVEIALQGWLCDRELEAARKELTDLG